MSKQIWLSVSGFLAAVAFTTLQPALAQPAPAKKEVGPACFECFWFIAENWRMKPHCRERPSYRYMTNCIATCTKTGDKPLVDQLNGLKDACDKLNLAINHMIEMGMMDGAIVTAEDLADPDATAIAAETAEPEPTAEMPATATPYSMPTIEMPATPTPYAMPTIEMAATPTPFVMPTIEMPATPTPHAMPMYSPATYSWWW